VTFVIWGCTYEDRAVGYVLAEEEKEVFCTNMYLGDREFFGSGLWRQEGEGEGGG